MHIGIIAHNAFGVMTGGNSGHIGGVEHQTALMARWFVNNRDHTVSIITWNEGQNDIMTVDGVRVISMCSLTEGIPGLRFFHPRWTSLNKAMKKANADVYYQNCGEYVTGQVALWCKVKKKKFIYSVASDPDCDPAFPKLHSYYEKVLYRYGLNNADNIIVQTNRQKMMISESFGRDSAIIPMPCPGPEKSEFTQPIFSTTKPQRIIWIGRIARVKRLEILLDIARKLPDYQFDVVGKANTVDDYTIEVIKRAEAIPNVTMHGALNRESINEMLKSTSLLCCTSAYEGFPNTFIEAWSYGIPVVSTFDPGGIIKTHGLGLYARDVPTLTQNIEVILTSSKSWQEASINARKYYLSNHTVDHAMNLFEKQFLNVLTQK